MCIHMPTRMVYILAFYEEVIGRRMQVIKKHIKNVSLVKSKSLELIRETLSILFHFLRV